MKNKLILLAVLVMFVGVVNSCKQDRVIDSYPILYVVNGTDYPVNVYCDNHLVAIAGKHNNSGKIELTNTSINLPVYVVAEFYDNKGNRFASYTWNNYYFRWNKTYKMTLTNSSSNSQLVEL